VPFSGGWISRCSALLPGSIHDITITHQTKAPAGRPSMRPPSDRARVRSAHGRGSSPARAGAFGIDRPASASAVVDLVLTQTASVWHERSAARPFSAASRSGTGRDLGILRVMPTFAISRALWVVGRCASRILSRLMGRAGIEPATLGLKVDAGALAWSRESSYRRMVERNRVRRSSRRLTKAC
jgi:hypothetical protein